MRNPSSERWCRCLALVLSVSAWAGCDDGSAPVVPCEPEQYRVGDECVDPVAIALNTVGYLPGQLKRATYAEAAGSSAFRLVTLEGDEVYSGAAVRSGDHYIADFSEFEEPGEYRLEVAESAHSASFRIAENVYDDPLDATMLGMYGQRCGEAVGFDWEGDHFQHRACHMNEGALDYAQLETDETHKDGTGGWHDAGDYGKYTVNGAFAVAMLLKAYEHFQSAVEERRFELPEQGGELPDILDEAKVEVEWLMKTQFDDGQASHKLTSLQFSPNLIPEFDVAPLYFTAAGTAATAGVVAVTALASRLYAPFDAVFAERCLKAAERGMQYLSEHPESVEAPVPDIFQTGSYGDRNQADERLWAMVEYWETTGDEELLAPIEAELAAASPQVGWDWPNTTNLSLYTYVLSERARDATLAEAIGQVIIEQADELAEFAETEPYGRALDYYHWGINGVVARLAMNLTVANRLSPSDQYLNTLRLQVDHLLGRNLYARSYVTGVGHAPPQQPHHRLSRADAVDKPWPGNLVGGPRDSADHWSDEYTSYETNEVAINWTTSMAYALIAAAEQR